MENSGLCSQREDQLRVSVLFGKGGRGGALEAAAPGKGCGEQPESVVVVVVAVSPVRHSFLVMRTSDSRGLEKCGLWL